MKLAYYREVIKKLQHRYHDLSDIRVAMDAVVEVAMQDYLSGGMDKKDYWRICVETAKVAYPEDKTEE